jgi:hypothetical protein
MSYTQATSDYYDYPPSFGTDRHYLFDILYSLNSLKEVIFYMSQQARFVILTLIILIGLLLLGIGEYFLFQEVRDDKSQMETEATASATPKVSLTASPSASLLPLSDKLKASSSARIR